MRHRIFLIATIVVIPSCVSHLKPPAIRPFIQSSVQSITTQIDFPTYAHYASQPKINCPLQIDHRQPIKLTGMKGYPTVVFSPDSRFVAATDRSGGSGLMVWEIATGKRKHFLPKGWMGEIDFSPDGKMLALGSAGGPAYIIDLSSNHIQKLMGHTRSINAIAFSPDGQSIVSSSADNTTRVWDLEGQNRFTIQGIAKAKFGTASERAPSMGPAAWNVHGLLLTIASPKQVQILENPKGFSVAKFSPDGNQIVTSSPDGLRLWDLDGNLQRHWSKDKKDPFDRLYFSPDSKRIIITSDDGQVVLWNSAGQMPTKFKGHRSYIANVAFSRDNQCVFTNSTDSDIRLWDISGQELDQLPSSSVMELSPDNQYLATTEASYLPDNNTTIQIWKLKNQR
jgi:WD40 repeat protein